LTQEPGGSTFHTLTSREDRPQRTRDRSGTAAEPAGASAIRRASWKGCWGVAGIRGTGRVQRRQCLALEPLGGRVGKARCSVRSSALPRRWGARTWPGSLAGSWGSPAATLPQPLHGPVRGRRRRQAHLGDHAGASFSWSGRRGGSASAVCAMAQPWTMVAWARGPRDQATLPSQRRRDRSVDGGAARCPWNTAQTHATAVGHQRVASGWQPRRGEPCATPWADCGGWDHARASVSPPGCPHGLGKRARTDSRTAAIRGTWAGCLLGKHREATRRARPL
jgi:hypothetical protein